MKQWRIGQRNWESEILNNEWARGNYVISHPDTTQQDIDDATKVLRQDNTADTRIVPTGIYKKANVFSDQKDPPL